MEIGAKRAELGGLLENCTPRVNVNARRISAQKQWLINMV
jgi:hypothetical protein